MGGRRGPCRVPPVLIKNQGIAEIRPMDWWYPPADSNRGLELKGAEGVERTDPEGRLDATQRGAVQTESSKGGCRTTAGVVRGEVPDILSGQYPQTRMSEYPKSGVISRRANYPIPTQGGSDETY